MSAASWKPKPSASRWPVVRLKVSCCSVSRPATSCISHISRPLHSKLGREGQRRCRKPPKRDTRRARGNDITPHGTQLVVHLPEGRKGVETEWPLTQNLDTAENDVPLLCKESAGNAGERAGARQVRQRVLGRGSRRQNPSSFFLGVSIHFSFPPTENGLHYCCPRGDTGRHHLQRLRLQTGERF